MRGGVSHLRTYHGKLRALATPGVDLGPLPHAQAIECNYRFPVPEERYREGDARQNRMRSDSERVATILERSGVQARLPRKVFDLGSCTGAVEETESYRNTNVIPLVASRNRRQMLNGLQYFICNEIRYPVRYGVVTSGQRKEVYGDLRGDMAAFHRRISKVANWAKEEYGINTIYRGDELPFDETLTFHLHANILYWQTRPMSPARWNEFKHKMALKFGSRWEDNGIIQDVAEVVKSLHKGDDISLLADLACMVPAWADREVPQAELIEIVAARIAAKRSKAQKRQVSPDECLGFAIPVVQQATAFFRAAAEAGKPHPLVWLFGQLLGMHLHQPSGAFAEKRKDWKNSLLKVHIHTHDDGSKYLWLKEKNTVTKGRLEKNEPLSANDATHSELPGLGIDDVCSDAELSADKSLASKPDVVENRKHRRAV